MSWLDFARRRGAILAAPGEIGLRAVTTNLNINFLAKPKARDRIAKGHVFRRLGRLR